MKTITMMKAMMKIIELLEQTVVPQTMAQNQPVQSASNNSRATQPAGATTTVQPTQTQTTTVQPTQTQTTTPAGQTTTPPNTVPQGGVQTGQPMASSATNNASNPAQAQQLQQTSDQTVTDLDKIAAQIVGLKQKQQQMQQQLQKPVV